MEKLTGHEKSSTVTFAALEKTTFRIYSPEKIVTRKEV